MRYDAAHLCGLLPNPLCYAESLIYRTALRITFLLAAAPLAAAQTNALLDAMSQELTRNFTILKDKADPKPYFLSYEITEQEFKTISGTLGIIDGSNGSKERQLDVSIRVGSPKLDNYHSDRGDRGQVTSGALITFEDSVPAIKRRLWLETDRAYRSAAQRLIRINTNSQVKVAAEDSSDDFSSEPAATFIQAPPKLKFDENEWSQRVRKLSARFQQLPKRPDFPRQRPHARPTPATWSTPKAPASSTAAASRAWSSGHGQSRRRHRPEHLRDLRSRGPDGLPDQRRSRPLSTSGSTTSRIS